MKRNVLLAYVIIFGVILSSCLLGINGNGNIVSQDRNVKDFIGVSLRGVGDVNVNHAEDFKVEVITDSNIQSLITIKVNGGNLHIDGESTAGGFNPTKLIINIYMPELVLLSLTGAGNINVLSGKTSNLQINLTGAGDINAQNYEVEDAAVNLSGAGDIKLWATNSLSGKLSGAGNILYKGNPSVNVNRTGVGKISRL